MNEEWKPGDVAFFDVAGEPVAAIRTGEGKWTAYASGVTRSWLDRPWDGLHGQRRAVVIDPEDREQVGQWRALLISRECLPTDRIEDWQSALREFANPTPPKPDEPTGLGAVVRDVNGVEWVRLHPDPGSIRPAQWVSTDDERRMRISWSRVDAVEVLSEGVPR